MDAFQFKDQDIEGQATLEAIAGAPRFNQWMYETTSRHLSGRILEIGSGIGNISAYYLESGRPLVLSDIRAHYCDFLAQKWAHHPCLEAVCQVDLVHPDFDTVYAHLLNSFDGVFALNVVEHIENDVLALHNIKKLLKKGGQVVILVPAYQALYNHFDSALGHYRRYTVRSLVHVFETNAFEVVHTQYFNAAAMAGWWFSGAVLKKKIIPKGQMRLYNALVPFFKVLDKCLGQKIGISAVVVGKKV